MSALSLFIFSVGAFWFIVFWFFRLNPKWALLAACIFLIFDPIFLFLRIPVLNNEINMLGVLFFTAGCILILLNRNVPTNSSQG
ncbi:MAG: hypothetical protein JSV04_07930 [Candidatus Heimdallarchaeota archaeon]|nr:MAG: hypothetical protein JSV04_07930 [Candidatus Heimdallarchaeota archaeon]